MTNMHKPKYKTLITVYHSIIELTIKCCCQLNSVIPLTSVMIDSTETYRNNIKINTIT